MSNPLAIATVTAALRNLLMQVTVELPDATVTAKPLRKARSDQDSGNQLNLFLYQTAQNAAWHKKLPDQAQMNGSDILPLALNLYYLITAYGRNDDSLLSHRLLGQAMSILHDHAVFSPAELRAALPGNDLHEQIEQVRIAPQPLSSEELSKLWNILQAPYEISAAYQVSVILITQQQEIASLNSVNRVNAVSHQLLATAQSQSTFSTPTLTELQSSNQRSNYQPGDIVTLQGHELVGDKVTVFFRNLHPKINSNTNTSVLEGTATQIRVQIPTNSDVQTGWTSGFYAVSAGIHRVGQPARTTNELALALATKIVSVSPNPISLNQSGDVLLTITSSLLVLPEQAAILMMGDRELSAHPRSTPTKDLVFTANAIVPGEYSLYLRIDGVDSLSVNCTVNSLLQNAPQEPPHQEVKPG